MIEAGGKQFRTRYDDFYVNGEKVKRAYCNGSQVYPEKGTFAKIRGEISENTLVTYHANTLDSARGLAEDGVLVWTVSGVFEAVFENQSEMTIDRTTLNRYDVYPYEDVADSWRAGNDSWNAVPSGISYEAIVLNGFEIGVYKAKFHDFKLKVSTNYFVRPAHTTSISRTDFYKSWRRVEDKASLPPFYNGALIQRADSEPYYSNIASRDFSELEPVEDRYAPSGISYSCNSVTAHVENGFASVDANWVFDNYVSRYKYTYPTPNKDDIRNAVKEPEYEHVLEARVAQSYRIMMIPITQILYLGDYDDAPDWAKVVEL